MKIYKLFCSFFILIERTQWFSFLLCVEQHPHKILLCMSISPLFLDGNILQWWRRRWHPTPVLLPGKSHGRRSLVGYRPWGHQESDTTERLPFHFSLSCIGEGNGNPLQCSCLENPRDGGAWWAAVYGVTQSQTRLKWLSSSSILQWKFLTFSVTYLFRILYLRVFFFFLFFCLLSFWYHCNHKLLSASSLHFGIYHSCLWTYDIVLCFCTYIFDIWLKMESLVLSLTSANHNLI